MALLVDKYQPKSLDDLVGNEVNIQKAVSWLEDFQNEIENTPRALFISGKPGIGKTSMAKLLLQKFNYHTVEFNSSDIRNQRLVREKLENIIGKVNISSMMGGCKFCGIIMDEVDGMSTGDKGGVSELISFINPNKGKKKKDKKKLKYQNPIICICNSEKEKKIQELKKECMPLKFLSPKLSELYNFAELIIKKEKISVSEDKLLDIVNFSQKDIRKLVGNIQFIMLGSQKKKKSISKKIKLDTTGNINSDKWINGSQDIIESDTIGLSKKTEETNLFQSVFDILDKFDNLQSIILLAQNDRNLVNLLVHENIISAMQNYNLSELKKIKLLEMIYYYMSESDMLESYLYNNYHHELAEVNSIIRCGATSYLLNKNTKKKHLTFQNNQVVYSKLMSRFSVQHQNYNLNMHLQQKIHLKNNIKNNYHFYQLIIKKIIKSMNHKKIDTSLKYYLTKYQITIENLEKINKQLKINFKGTRNEKDFYLEATSEVDKKYFTKFFKLFELY